LVVNQNGVKITQPGRIAYVRALFVPRYKLLARSPHTSLGPTVDEVQRDIRSSQSPQVPLILKSGTLFGGTCLRSILSH